MREPFTIEHTPGGRTFLRGAGTLVLLIVIAVIAFSSTSCVRTGHVGIVSIFGRVARQVAARGIIVESVLLRDLQLPDTLKHAIEAKQQAQQEAQRMEFVLQREKQEAERKRVEAAGIKDFQDIVTQGISEKLLEWKGIEATLELAKSQNSKVVVVGNSRNGLPLIYSGE